MSAGLGGWSKTASEVELVEGLDVLAHELRQRMGKENVADPEEALDEPAAPKLLTVKEAADRLGVSTARVYALVREKRIGGVVHIGRQVRFEGAAFEAWVRDGGTARNADRPQHSMGRK